MTSTTWVQNAGMDSGTDSDTVLTYAEAAQAAAEAAAASQAAAAASVLGAAEQASASSGFASVAEAAATSATSTAAALTGFDLEAIAAIKAVTAVDVFVYDTSKDSDGGAWRKRTQGTSWYNETLNTSTRGSRREFPAVAVIVAEAAKATIYDGDDPSLPMWMVFGKGTSGSTAWSQNVSIIGITSNSSVTTVSGMDGKICLGKDYTSNDTARAFGLFVLDFTSDTSVVYAGGGSRVWPLTIADRDTLTKWGTADAAGAIVNGLVNDVAMTVLPDAPIDPATGLPVPTIAVATDGGVSVITDSGAVYDSSVINQWLSVQFSDDLLFASAKNNVRALYAYKVSDLIADGFTQSATVYNTKQGVGGYPRALNATDFFPKSPVPIANRDLAIAGDIGLSQVTFPVLTGNSASPTGASAIGSLLAYTTSTYNTGWMNGDIKGAFLSDTDDTDLVATDTISDRSVNDLTLTLGDGCTVAAVATGADLVGYTFASAEAVTLGTDISSTGALVWWEEVSGVWHLYVNDLSGGTDYDNGFAGTVGTGLTISGTTFTFAASKKMALARATATIPTASQIKKIYNDEKVLFQENAQATLYGTSDAVTALAHDSDTNLLHVGTSDGRSVFQGLRRVSNTTTAVGTAISASNGLVVEE